MKRDGHLIDNISKVSEGSVDLCSRLLYLGTASLVFLWGHRNPNYSALCIGLDMLYLQRNERRDLDSKPIDYMEDCFNKDPSRRLVVCIAYVIIVRNVGTIEMRVYFVLVGPIRTVQTM